MSTLPDYIVVRGTNSRFDETWFDLVEVLPDRRAMWADYVNDDGAVRIGPTGMFEVREDGVVAEVWAPQDT